jgi:predicted outer membrane repeat protein
VGRGGSLENTQFTANTATHYPAGGLRADGPLTLTNLIFVDNQAAYCGGGLTTFSYTAPALIYGGEFRNNTSVNSAGGGLCVYGPTTLLNTRVLNNHAQYGGGAYFLTLGHFDGGLIQGNTATGYGGGLYASQSLVLSGTQVLANQGERGGGAYLYLGGGQVINTLLAGNTAASGLGHALAAETAQLLVIVHSTLAAPNFTPGSAVYLTGTAQSGITNTLLANYAVGLEAAAGAVYEDYNLFSGLTTPTVGTTGGTHDRLGSAGFIAPASGNYHLGQASAAVDHASPATGVAADFDGDPRPFGPLPDIGYDEYTGNYKLDLPLIIRFEPPGN